MMRRILGLVLLAAAISTPVSRAQISVRTPLSDDKEVRPDTTYDGVIQVWNESAEHQQVRVYQTDYLFFADGSNFYGAPGSVERSNAAWTEVTEAVLTVPPNDWIPVTYRVNVPRDVAGSRPEGTYWSMIMIEAVPKESPESTLDEETGEPEYAVLQIMRYGVQVATHIEGTGQSVLQLSGTGLEPGAGGSTVLGLNVENSGTRLIRPEVWVELYRTDGTAIGRRDGVQNRIYPGTSVRQEIDLGSLEAGSYRALVVLDGGDDNVFGAELNLDIN